MRIVFLALVTGGLFLGHAQASRPTLPSVPLNGERYISLQEWARVRGFAFRWNPADRAVLVTSDWARLEFNTNSKRASINNNTIWLSSIVPVSGDTVYVSERDVFKTLHPILYPEELPPRKPVRTIVLAPGHGGRDPGYQINAHQEKKYTLLMCKVLKETLEGAGFRVILTRDKDVFVDLDEQALIATKADADLFVTVHFNAALEVSAKGIETYCLTPVGAVSTNGGQPSGRSPGHACDPYNALLAYKVHKQMLLDTEFEDRGIRRARFQVLREITMPGIYIEGGFLSNPYDAKKIMSPSYRRRTAKAITEGILVYNRLIGR